MLENIFFGAGFLLVVLVPAVPDLYRFFWSGEDGRLFDAAGVLLFSAGFWAFAVFYGYYALYEGPLDRLYLSLGIVCFFASLLLSFNRRGWGKLRSFGTGAVIFVAMVFFVFMAHGKILDMRRGAKVQGFKAAISRPLVGYAASAEGEKSATRLKFRESLSCDDTELVVGALLSLDYLGKDAALLLDEVAALENHREKRVRWLAAWHAGRIRRASR